MATVKEKIANTKLGPHYTIERFGILFIILIICLALVLGSCFIAKINADNASMTDTAVYNTEFITSRTQHSGAVVDVYANTDQTEAFLLLKFSDFGSMPRDAKNYQAFLTGSSIKMKKTRLQSSPSGIIYVFGSTGYLGIYLSNPDVFPQQICELTLRCNKELVAVDDESIQTDYDNSFKEYDQLKVFFNPGGKDATRLACLDDDGVPSVRDLYTQCIIESQEDSIREALDTDLAVMQADLKLIDESKERLESLGVQVPNLPSLIAGDVVETVDGENEGESYLNFKPATIVSKGYNYDWRSGSVYEGYLDNLVGDSGLSYAKYMAAIASQADDKFVLPDASEWVMIDGSPVPASAEDAGSDTVYQNINNDINDWCNNCSAYYDVKIQYQVNDLKSLLSLEIDSKSIDSGATMNTEDSAITLW